LQKHYLPKAQLIKLKESTGLALLKASLWTTRNKELRGVQEVFWRGLISMGALKENNHTAEKRESSQQHIKGEKVKKLPVEKRTLILFGKKKKNADL